jgi:adenosine deaminase CECR1
MLLILLIFFKQFFIFRSQDNETIQKAVKLALTLVDRYPDYVVGYDLVGQEDKGHSLKYFLPQLTYPSRIGRNLTYFFHAGETSMDYFRE